MWICSDPDTGQFYRKLSYGVYEFMQGTDNATIDVNEYTHKQIDSAISSFGYKRDLGQGTRLYRPTGEGTLNEEESFFLIAECIFETESLTFEKT